MVFTILISNTDDHLRNHGFLHERGESWILSPAFDLNPNPGPGPKNLSTRIDYDSTRASIETLMTVAPEFRLDADGALETLAKYPGSRTLARSCCLPRIAATRPGHDGAGVRACRSQASLGLDRGPFGERSLSHIAGSVPVRRVPKNE